MGRLDFRVRDTLVHLGDTAKHQERDALHLEAFCPGHKRMGELVDEHTKKEPQRHDGSQDPWHVACRNQAGVDGHREEIFEHVRRERDLAADNPGKQRDYEQKCVMDQDRYAKNPSDPK